MKKFLSIVLTLSLSCFAFAGCSSSQESTSYDASAVVDSIAQSVSIGETRDMTEEDLTIAIGLDMANVESYAGKFSMVSTSADQIIAVCAADGQVETVKSGLETYKENLAKSFANYAESETQMQKAEAGRVVTKGNCVVLVIAGDDAAIQSSGVDEAYKSVDTAIEEAFK